MNVEHTQLPVADLRPGYGPSAYREEGCPPLLLRSLKQHGQLFPLLVMEEESGFTLVCGHRRTIGIYELGFRFVKVGVLPPVSDIEVLRLSVADNSTSGGFTDAERIRILNRLFTTHAMSQSDVAEHWMPFLSLPASRDLAGKYHGLCSDPVLFDAVDTDDLTPGTAIRLLIIPVELRPAVLSLIKTWNLTTSESREYIHILDEMIRRDGMSPDDISALSADDSGLSGLRRIRFPKQQERSRKLQILAGNLPSGCTIRPSRHEGLTLEVSFTGRSDFSEKISSVKEILGSHESGETIDSF